MAPIRYRTADVDGFKVFYREAGPADAPKLLLLHGFPSAGHMFRDLIPLLADRFHIVAPNLPGFGQSAMPPRGTFEYTFDNISRVIDRFSEVWSSIKAYWQDPSPANRKALRAFLTPETTRWQYTHGVPDPTMVSPDGQNLDNFYLARPGADEVQLDFFGDYKSNVALYPSFQEYFRTHKPPLLAVWGKNDPFFVPPGAEAFKRDNPRAVVRFFDTGHFALETHAREIADSIRDFLR